MIKEKIIELAQKIDNEIIENKEQLEKFRLTFISNKGELPKLFKQIKTVDQEERREIGKQMNELKNTALQKFQDFSEKLLHQEQIRKTREEEYIDLTLPPTSVPIMGLHPITHIRKQIIEIFEHVGFSLENGPEIEDDWHNFTALNFPENHPAREMQDTFFIEKNPDKLLRTHTSSVQIRKLCIQTPPIRILSPGRVYRNETISARTNNVFHQVEGLYVDKNVSFMDMKTTLWYFAKEMFGKQIKIRLRPSFFPFTEPSAELDIPCFICRGKGCNVCKYTGWVEIIGCGMVDPKVLENCSISSKTYTGFAFGMGIERIAMLRYQINDLRLFMENDIRFLQQFAVFH